MNRRQKNEQTITNKHVTTNPKMVKMMIACVTAFTLCWLPFNTLVVVGDQYPEIFLLESIAYIWFACHWLAMSHAAYNPLIYIWMNSRFRCGFKYVFSFLPGFRLPSQLPDFLPHCSTATVHSQAPPGGFRGGNAVATSPASLRLSGGMLKTAAAAKNVRVANNCKSTNAASKATNNCEASNQRTLQLSNHKNANHNGQKLVNNRSPISGSSVSFEEITLQSGAGELGGLSSPKDPSAGNAETIFLSRSILRSASSSSHHGKGNNHCVLYRDASLKKEREGGREGETDRTKKSSEKSGEREKERNLTLIRKRLDLSTFSVAFARVPRITSQSRIDRYPTGVFCLL